jgi:hypothetical protein
LHNSRKTGIIPLADLGPVCCRHHPARPRLHVHQSVFDFSCNSDSGGDLLNDGYTLMSPSQGLFKLQFNAAEEYLCFFRGAMASIPAASHVVSRG